MNTNALRQKILDLAIHGKLVKQDPADESAAILLEKIRAEKEKKIASGDLKRGKNDSYIFFGDDNRHYEKFADGRVKDIENEIPFAVPEGWVWCRLGEVADIARGGSPRPIEDFITDKENGINWIKIGDTVPESKYITSAKEKIKPEGKKYSRFVHVEDFLLTNSMSFGRPYILKIDGCIHDGWLVFADIIKYLLKDFLYYALSSQYIYNSFSLVAAGSTVKNLKADTVKQVLFPLPPLLEQKRIITNIEAIFAQIDILEQNKADLQTVVKHTKSKILDLAIRGKLVPQDTADEPASVMLEKLRAEKEAKIAAGEIKRSKNDSHIYKNSTDNCYYEKFGDGTEKATEMLSAIPESWTWSHFGDVADVINGKNQSQVEDDTGEYPIYGSGGIMGYANDYICPENCTIIGRKGSINNPIFVEEKLWNVDTAFGLAPSSIVLPRYLFYFCKSFDFTSLDSSTTLPSLTKTSIQRILFPLPPLAAQKRILDKIDELFSQLDKISLNII